MPDPTLNFLSADGEPEINENFRRTKSMKKPKAAEPEAA